MSSIRKWARELAQWIKQFFAVPQRPVVLAEDYNAHAAIYRVTDDSIPGCVELWKIVHRQSTGDLILLLLDMGRLRQELGLRTDGTSTRAEPWQNKLSRQLGRELKAQSDVDGSHLVVVVWLRDRSLLDPKGRRYRMPTADLVGAWACEFQGLGGSLTGNRYASQIVKLVAYKQFKREATPSISWEQLVGISPWLKWLDAYAKHYLGDDHVLQPPKRRKTPPQPQHF